MTIHHVSLPVTSLSDSTAFYLAILAPLNYSLFMTVPNGKSVGLAPKYGGPDFWLHSCSEKATSGKDGKGVAHVAFTAGSKKAVGAFYAAALYASSVRDSRVEEANVSVGKLEPQTTVLQVRGRTLKAIMRRTCLILREIISNVYITSLGG
jgi:catechol 2,3-dioxygenase-like lactoylglutathione lyase family enzyme